ncbi:hypothetical protein N9L68_08150 [bacterium]|nr:hypothetical protein [bacterium]
MVAATDGKIQRDVDGMPVTLAFAKKEDVLSRLQERGYINLSPSSESEVPVAAASGEAIEEVPYGATRERRGDAEERISTLLAVDESRSEPPTTAASEVAPEVVNQELALVEDPRSQYRRAERSSETASGPPAAAESAQWESDSPWKDWRSGAEHSGWSDSFQGSRWSSRPRRAKEWYPSGLERASAAGNWSMVVPSGSRRWHPVFPTPGIGTSFRLCGEEENISNKCHYLRDLPTRGIGTSSVSVEKWRIVRTSFTTSETA